MLGQHVVLRDEERPVKMFEQNERAPDDLFDENGLRLGELHQRNLDDFKFCRAIACRL